MTTHAIGPSTPKPVPSPVLFTPQEAAEYLGLSRSSIYQLLNSGRLPSVRILRARKIRVADLERLVAEGC